MFELSVACRSCMRTAEKGVVEPIAASLLCMNWMIILAGYIAIISVLIRFRHGGSGNDSEVSCHLPCVPRTLSGEFLGTWLENVLAFVMQVSEQCYEHTV